MILNIELQFNILSIYKSNYNVLNLCVFIELREELAESSGDFKIIIK